MFYYENWGYFHWRVGERYGGINRQKIKENFASLVLNIFPGFHEGKQRAHGWLSLNLYACQNCFKLDAWFKKLSMFWPKGPYGLGICMIVSSQVWQPAKKFKFLINLDNVWAHALSLQIYKKALQWEFCR